MHSGTMALSLPASLRDVAEENEELRRKIRRLEAQASTYQEITIPGFSKRIEALEANGAALETALASSKNVVSAVTVQFEDAAKEVEYLKHRRADEAMTVNTMCEAYNTELHVLKEKVAALEAMAEEKQALLQQNEQEGEALRQKSEEMRVALEKQASTFEERIAVLLADSDATSSQLRQSKEKCQEHVDALEAFVDALRDVVRSQAVCAEVEAAS